MYRFIGVLLVLLCGFVVDSAKILAVFPGLGYSQYFVGEPLLVHLAEKGHEITLISFHTPKTSIENINSIQVAGLKSSLKGSKFVG